MSDTTAEQDVQFEVRDSIAFVTFNRPQARNAFTFAMYEKLAEIAAQVDADTAIRAMILTGAGGKAFAAGTDISQFQAFKTPADALAYEARIDRVLTVLEKCRVPTIAAIAGACTGGGAGIAGCCDIRIGASNAKFGLPIARTLGNCLSMSNFSRFADLVGTARLKDMIFTARLIEAEEALRIGLISELVEDHAAVLARAEALARTIATHAPLTLKACKEALRVLRPSVDPAVGEELIISCYMSRDFQEGMDAFLTKRTPHFTGT
ncbi:MAG: enoyl-CoA hydratase [Beijerinckiaceae bacterium]